MVNRFNVYNPGFKKIYGPHKVLVELDCFRLCVLSWCDERKKEQTGASRKLHGEPP